MNTQERLRVARLVSRLASQPDMPKDEDAMLELNALQKVRPDAPYLLMQRVLMLELMLEEAQLELEQLRQGRQAAPSVSPAQQLRPVSRGFAERLLHRLAPSSTAPATAAPGMPGSSFRGTTMTPAAGGGFLRNAAAVGAGVLGGSLLFQGLENLFDGDEEPAHRHYGDEHGLADMGDAGFAGNDPLEGGSFDDAGGDAGGGGGEWA